MFSFGFLAEITGSQRSSVLALMVYFIIGFLLLMYTRNVFLKENTEKGSEVI
jgi:MFS-type transporter involved in bile tolerance (Atg22 family)